MANAPLPVTDLPDGILYALALDSNGSAQHLNQTDLADGWMSSTLTWVHGDFAEDGAENWLRHQPSLSEGSADYLLADETRPGLTLSGDGLLVILRTLNRNPGATPEDMISVRLWLDQSRIVSLRTRKVGAFADIRTELEQGRGPSNAGEWLGDVVEHLVNDCASFSADVAEQVGNLETAALSEGDVDREGLAQLRLRVAEVRRFLVPQVLTLESLSTLKASWLSTDQLQRLSNARERLKRVVDDLDMARERLITLREESDHHLDQQLNRRLYLLSVVAGIFLPLGFLTGLFGINVGRIPLTDHPQGFLIVCGGLAAIGLGLFALLRYWSWFR